MNASGTADSSSFTQVYSFSAGGNLTATTFTGALAGNAATVTNGVYTTGNQSIAGIKTFTTALRVTGTTKAAAYFYAGTTNPSNTTRTNYDGNFHVNNLFAINNVTAYASDDRLKNKISNIDNALTKVKTLNGFLYTWNEDAERLAGFDKETVQVGVSAQRVRKVLPEAVKIAPFDVGEFGESKSGEEYLTVQYDKLVPLLIEAIKEQQKQIESHALEIQKLKNVIKNFH
jgi:hypothetical protein